MSNSKQLFVIREGVYGGGIMLCHTLPLGSSVNQMSNSEQQTVNTLFDIRLLFGKGSDR